MTHLFRPPRPRDVTQIQNLAVAAGMFPPDGVGFFDDLLQGFFSGSLVDNYWHVASDPHDTIIAASYVAPEPFADRIWNLYFICVSPTHQRRGIGESLLKANKDMLRGLGSATARILIVDTSSTDAYAGARAFYQRPGFDEEARIRDFYGPADDKVTFWKSLV